MILLCLILFSLPVAIVCPRGANDEQLQELTEMIIEVLQEIDGHIDLASIITVQYISQRELDILRAHCNAPANSRSALCDVVRRVAAGYAASDLELANQRLTMITNETNSAFGDMRPMGWGHVIAEEVGPRISDRERPMLYSYCQEDQVRGQFFWACQVVEFLYMQLLQRVMHQAQVVNAAQAQSRWAEILQASNFMNHSLTLAAAAA